MAAPRFLQLLTSGFSQAVSAAVVGGASSANQIVGTNNAGILDISLMPAGIGADVVSVPATEALAAGALVNIYNNSGTASARNADSSSAAGGKKISGFVLAAVASGGTATVYRSGQNTGVTGLTPGADYWLSTGGGVSTTPDTASGHTTQYAGTAISATVLDVQPLAPIGNA